METLPKSEEIQSKAVAFNSDLERQSTVAAQIDEEAKRCGQIPPNPYNLAHIFNLVLDVQLSSDHFDCILEASKLIVIRDDGLFDLMYEALNYRLSAIQDGKASTTSDELRLIGAIAILIVNSPVRNERDDFHFVNFVNSVYGADVPSYILDGIAIETLYKDDLLAGYRYVEECARFQDLHPSAGRDSFATRGLYRGINEHVFMKLYEEAVAVDTDIDTKETRSKHVVEKIRAYMEVEGIESLSDKDIWEIPWEVLRPVFEFHDEYSKGVSAYKWVTCYVDDLSQGGKMDPFLPMSVIAARYEDFIEFYRLHGVFSPDTWLDFGIEQLKYMISDLAQYIRDDEEEDSWARVLVKRDETRPGFLNERLFVLCAFASSEDRATILDAIRISDPDRGEADAGYIETVLGALGAVEALSAEGIDAARYEMLNLMIRAMDRCFYQTRNYQDQMYIVGRKYRMIYLMLQCDFEELELSKKPLHPYVYFWDLAKMGCEVDFGLLRHMSETHILGMCNFYTIELDESDVDLVIDGQSSGMFLSSLTETASNSIKSVLVKN